MTIALIGYRGTGKTTVARLLAEQLNWCWVDADVQLEQNAGRSIAEIFATEGEAGFRDRETRELKLLVARERCVLALGGGVVIRAENRGELCRTMACVWLQARPETLHQRIAADATTAARRPNLTALSGVAEIQRLLCEREPWYRECATHSVDTEGKSPADVAREILHAIGPLVPSPVP